MLHMAGSQPRSVGKLLHGQVEPCVVGKLIVCLPHPGIQNLLQVIDSFLELSYRTIGEFKLFRGGSEPSVYRMPVEAPMKGDRTLQPCLTG